MDGTTSLEQRIDALVARGVVVVDRRQLWIAPEVDLARVHPEVVLYPGTRLEGARTWLGPRARIGTEGPATLSDTVLDAGASIASGYAAGVVLLANASLGANAHVRAGTLLEEEASTAHAVGLKQTILLSFVTLGSLINFCDCLMSGGTSRQDHSEVGSGYIHFNYTPWGERGDKATASLVGDVVHGVFLRERRIFLGGTGGLVGPARIGFGAIAAAGQVWRGDLAGGRLRLEPPRKVDRELGLRQLDRVQPRARKNLEYLGELHALRAWYEQVRLPRVPAASRPVLEAALENLEACRVERERQLERFLRERGVEPPAFTTGRDLPVCPLPIAAGPSEHIAWVRALSDEQVTAGVEWLTAIAQGAVAEALAAVPT